MKSLLVSASTARPSILFLFLHRHAKAVSVGDAREQLKKLLMAAQTDGDAEGLTTSVKTSLKQVPTKLSGKEDRPYRGSENALGYGA